MTTTRIWYDRSTKNWIGQVLDLQGNQLGDAEFAATRREIQQALRDRTIVALTHAILGGRQV
jgi:hypothetical protein